jgi:hypothetical protein
MIVCANTGPAASESSAKTAIRVFIFNLHHLPEGHSRCDLARSGDNRLLANKSIQLE